MNEIGLVRIVGVPRNDNALVYLIDLLQLSQHPFVDGLVVFEVVILSAEDGMQVDESEVELVRESGCDLVSFFLLVALDADDLPLVSLFDVVDQIIDGIVWPFQQQFFCYFGEEMPQFVFLDVFLRLKIGF